MKAAKKYPARSNNPIYVAKWNDFIEDVTSRENFKMGHLNQLNILCDLYVDYANLKDLLEYGTTYESQGRNGKQIKMRPEVAQKDKVVQQIAVYSKMLGLLLTKDREEAGASGDFDS